MEHQQDSYVCRVLEEIQWMDPDKDLAQQSSC